MSDIFFVIALFFWGLMIVRVSIYRKVLMRRLDEVSLHNRRCIDAGRYDDRAPYPAEGGIEGYLTDLLDLRKWTYRQFFPEVL